MELVNLPRLKFRELHASSRKAKERFGRLNQKVQKRIGSILIVGREEGVEASEVYFCSSGPTNYHAADCLRDSRLV